MKLNKLHYILKMKCNHPWLHATVFCLLHLSTIPLLPHHPVNMWIIIVFTMSARLSTHVKIPLLQRQSARLPWTKIGDLHTQTSMHLFPSQQQRVSHICNITITAHTSLFLIFTSAPALSNNSTCSTIPYFAAMIKTVYPL